jgi:hypothetical protein
MVTVDKKDGRPFMLAQDRRTVYELEVDGATRDMDVEGLHVNVDVVDLNDKGKRRMHDKIDDRVPVICRHVVDALKSMAPIADVALATGQDLYAVTTDVRHCLTVSISTAAFVELELACRDGSTGTANGWAGRRTWSMTRICSRSASTPMVPYTRSRTKDRFYGTLRRELHDDARLT